jgi:hypothetical protein
MTCSCAPPMLGARITLMPQMFVIISCICVEKFPAIKAHGILPQDTTQYAETRCGSQTGITKWYERIVPQYNTHDKQCGQ